MQGGAVDSALDFSVHALKAVFSKWLIACELWSPVQFSIIIVCRDIECEQHTFFARSERWCSKSNCWSFETGAVGVMECIFLSFLAWLTIPNLLMAINWWLYLH